MIVSEFWPLAPRKFVFISGARKTVPTSTTSAMTIVIAECFSVQRMIGR